MITAELKQPEIVAMLSSYGIGGIHLKSHEDRTYTYHYTSIDMHKVERMLGKPAVTSNGKVAIYTVPGVGKIGIAQHADLVRVIDNTKKQSSVSDSHIAKTEVTPELHMMFLQAAANPSKRVAYMKKLWQYFNTHKFHGKMEMPKLVTSVKCPFHMPANTRGAHLGGPNFTAGTVWMADFMFNAREPFFLEVFLHELCHAAVWQIDKVSDRAEQGHGAHWKAWMVKVGLDSRRYDPTDDTEYQVGPAKDVEEEKRFTAYGPPTDPKVLKKLHRMELPTSGSAAYYYKGRLFHGILDTKKKTFEGAAPNNKITTWKFKTLQGQPFYYWDHNAP